MQGTLWNGTELFSNSGHGERIRQTQAVNSDSNGEDSTTVPPHLNEMFESICTSGFQGDRETVAALLCEYGDVFSCSDDDLGLTHLGEHAIVTGNAAPIKQPPHRVPTAFAGEEEKAIENLKKQGTIRPSNSAWASPIVLVRKKNGSVQPCVDYRRLNNVTEKDAFPLPRTSDCLDAVSGAQIFSTLDITSAYNQIPVCEADIPKTTVVTEVWFL